MTRTDVVIVGGGIAGLIAARELRLAGLRCIVVEARDRLGGRIWTKEHFGKRRDVGATFVHWSQPHAWAEVTRYGLALAARPPIDTTVALAGGMRMEGNLASLWQLISDGMDAFCADCREVFPIPYEYALTRPLLDADDLSMADRIAQLAVSEEARAIIDGFWTVNCNRPADEGGLTHALHWVAGTGGDWKVFNEACARYKLADGLGALVDAIHAHGRPEVLLGEAVRVVEQTESEVVVITEYGREIQARACIVALPLNVLGTIDFRPALSEGKQDILAQGAPAGGFKLWARTERPLDASYLCMTSGDEPLTFARTEDTLGSGTILGFYGPDKRRLDRESRDGVQELVQRWIPEARIAEVWSYDWHADPHSRETWRIARPGQLSRYAKELSRREGNVLLAGADIALGVWNGYVDGAIESGLNAAREAAAQLNGHGTD